MKQVRSSSILSILFLLGILVMINAIGIRQFLRVDLTSARMYSLSKASKQIVGTIDDTLVIKCYFSPDLPSPYNTTARYLRDMLEDYRAFSKGHIQYSFIDPGSEEALEKEAQSFNIPPQQFRTVQNDKFEAKLGYMGVVFIYGDRKEVIPFVQDSGNLEYEITSLINRVTSPQLPKLAVTTTGIPGDLLSTQNLYEALGRNFSPQQIDLLSPVSKDVAGLFVIAPRRRFTEWELFNLDQYIMGGGKVAIMANSYDGVLDPNNPFSTYRDLNLDRFLRHYGIALNPELVFDKECGTVGVQTKQGFFSLNQRVPVPYLPITTTFNRSHLITRGLERLPLFFPSSVDTTLAAAKGYRIEGLFYTSKDAGVEQGSSITTDVMRTWRPEDYTKSYIPLAAVVSGTFTSYFADSGIPPRSKFNADGDIVVDSTQVADVPFIRAATGENRLMLVGDGNITIDSYTTGNSWGLTFLMNTADWLVQSESLITIRSKQITPKPLRKVSDATRRTIKMLNQVGPVILVVFLGILLWQVRRVRKKRLVGSIANTQGE